MSLRPHPRTVAVTSTVLTALTLLALVLSAWPRISGRHVDLCAARIRSFRRIYHAVRTLGTSPTCAVRTDLPVPRAPEPAEVLAHRSVRVETSALLSLQTHPQIGTCHTVKSLSPRKRRRLEWARFSRYPLDGVLLYVFAVVGTQSRVVVEVDGAHARGVFAGSAMFASLHGWNVVALHQTWSGYSRAQQYYDQQTKAFRKQLFPDAVVHVYETRCEPYAVEPAVAKQGIAGPVDLMLLFTDGGRDVLTWQHVAQKTSLRPRVVALFYQDFWGPSDWYTRYARFTGNSTSSAQHARSVKGEHDGVDLGRARLFVGGSIRALTQTASQLSYQLVWCLASTPIALFIDAAEEFPGDVLPALTEENCLSARQSGSDWRKNAEAQWDAAHSYHWDSYIVQP